MVMKESKLCYRCKGTIIRSDDELVCSKCGFVVEDRFEDDTYDYDDRVGSPRTLMYNDISTVISNKTTDASGNKIQNNLGMKRIKMWDDRIRSNPNRNTSKAMTEISRVSDILQIPDNIQQRAAEIYLDCEKRRMLRGRTIGVFAISCLYAACREGGIPKTLQSFVQETYAKRTDITSYYRLILTTLDIKPTIQTPVSYVGKIASKVNPPLNQFVQRLAQEILEKYDGSAGKDPIGLAASALYIACVLKDLGITQRHIALASDVTEVTIRNRFKGLYNSYVSSPSADQKTKDKLHERFSYFDKNDD